MKQLFKIKYILPIIVMAGLWSAISCKEEMFDYEILDTHSDGIQNLDEEGVDCGGSSGVNCPTCSDGIKNGDETGIDCGGANCPECPAATPRADVLKTKGLPYYYTFESGQEQSGKGLVPMHTNPDGSAYGQGVDAFYGEQDPLGSVGAVTKMIRPSDGRFGGYEDFKFQTFNTPIDFSVYHKWTMEVFIPTGQDFSGALLPQVVLILHDYINGNFYERWTEIPITIDEADFGKWVTLEFDGTIAAAAGSGVLLPAQTTYTNISLRFGGGGHTKSGIFYVKDLVPTTKTFGTPSTTPRADALASSGLPYYFTFESDDAGLLLAPFTVNADGSPYGQGVDISYGDANPSGPATDLVAKVVRPSDGRFGGYEDYKFQTFTAPIDFSVYHKWKMDVFIPSGQEFSGGLVPQVVLILMDYNANFWERWTEIPITVSQSDFGKWVTLTFDGTNAAAAGSGVLLPAQTTYTNISLRFGGGGHTKSGIFYVKDFVPFQ